MFQYNRIGENLVTFATDLVVMYNPEYNIEENGKYTLLNCAK